MANFCIEIIDETGERKCIPLWKLPQLCAEDVSQKQAFVAAEKAAKEAREKAEAMAKEAFLKAQLAELEAVNNPVSMEELGKKVK